MVNHQKSRDCLRKAAPTGNIEQFFIRHAPAAATSQRTPAKQHAPLPVLPNLRMSDHPDIGIDVRASSPLLPKRTSEHESNPILSPCLRRLHDLRMLARNLPESVPIADPEDDIAALGASGEEYVIANGFTEDTTEDYECHLSRALHRVFWDEKDDAIFSKIRRGPFGVEGFCAVLEFFIRERSASKDLIDVRLPRLEKAIRNLITCGSSSTCHALEWMLLSHTSSVIHAERTRQSGQACGKLLRSPSDKNYCFLLLL